MPLILILAYIFIEIAFFAGAGGAIGVLPTLLLVVAGFFAGGWMIRYGGEGSRRFFEQAGQGRIDADFGPNLYWMLGGLLVILPGFFTDLIGIVLVVAPVRRLFLRLLGVVTPERVQKQVIIHRGKEYY